ncbi:hypothetical protein BB8028_0006g02970 [Beauveria bassiana]|uniref:Aminoglycoside phosphotransferase domain-containing protein n=1 Tax=Beauveria bassiana TaxID=176275 RepID=A0A2S7YII3_BEABA|nr:hypothetical protein BB8028_0006g02970 [Beauveria bassiana]
MCDRIAVQHRLFTRQSISPSLSLVIMSQAYDIDDSIKYFFESSTSVSRQQCDAFVMSRFKTPAQPVQVQGVWSYTVTAGANNPRIIQFREEHSSLDPSKMALVEQAASGFVADILYLGTIGEQRPLHIYEMNKLPGEVYIIAADHSIPQPDDAKSRQRNTIKDLARFFAQSWNCKLPPPSDPVTLAAEYGFKLGRLAETLPARFSQTLLSLESQLPLVFSKLPHSVTHGDLCELNILVDPRTGHITGIVDWAEVRVLPFGFALWAVENILGFMNAEGWHYYDNQDELRTLFWATFLQQAKGCTEQDMELIHTARLIGLFCRYGFTTEGEKILGVVGDEAISSLAYLDAFCLHHTTLS